MQVFVFANNKSAQRFKQYQAKRASRALKNADYRALKPLWPHTLAVYRTNGSRESIRYPFNAPKIWWH